MKNNVHARRNGRRALPALLALLLAGCASQRTVTVTSSAAGDRLECRDTGMAMEDAVEALRYHVMQVAPNGRYQPLRYTVTCNGRTEFVAQPADFDRWVAELWDHLASESNRNTLRVYIHGGLVEPEEAIGDAVLLSRAMLHDPALEGHSYPLIVTWRSGGVDSYFEQLGSVRNGEVNRPLAWATAPLKLGSDLGGGIANTAFAGGLEGNRLVESLTDTLNACTTDTAPPAKVICPAPQDFAAVPALTALGYFALMPARIGTAPFVNGFGRPAWENMVRHTREAFLRDTPPQGAVPQASDDAFHGAVYRLFHQLDRRLSDANAACRAGAPGPACLKLILIGHSMGTMLITDIVRHFPQLPYKDIVFMGAAVSIRDFADAVVPLLARDAPGDAGGRPYPWDIAFHSLSLLPVHEARERNLAYLVPSGSLLEWIDEMYTSPPTLADRTLGKWVNVRRTLSALPAKARDKMNFRVFGTQEGQPRKHGDFNDLATCFWRCDFWKTPDADWESQVRKPCADYLESLDSNSSPAKDY